MIYLIISHRAYPAVSLSALLLSGTSQPGLSAGGRLGFALPEKAESIGRARLLPSRDAGADNES